MMQKYGTVCARLLETEDWVLAGATRVLMWATISAMTWSVAGCSILNRQGVDASCADLAYGSVNACSDGIITTCHSGVVEYRVCESKSICDEFWQVEGAYRCQVTDPVPDLVASDVGSTASNPGSSFPLGYDGGPGQVFADSGVYTSETDGVGSDGTTLAGDSGEVPAEDVDASTVSPADGECIDACTVASAMGSIVALGDNASSLYFFGWKVVRRFTE
jgi:hypothetical protein